MVFRTGQNQHLTDQMETKISFNLNHLLWEC
jgi:tRNA splicing ligase